MTVQEWLGADNKIGIDIWEKKYRNNNESFDEWLDRVSGHDPEVRKLIEEKKFLFGGRILANRGTNQEVKTTYSNCYVLPAPEDNIESIFDTAKQLARTFSYGGGAGIDISKLAPDGAKVRNSAKVSSGAVSFMDLYSLVTGLISQSSRRGALMISMSCEHPDIEQFIDIKKDLTRVTKANISVRMTDKFMQAVVDDKPFELSFTREETGETISKTVNARDILMKLARNNWEMGEPGVLFWDRVESWNMLSEYDNFKFGGVNPCSEEPLPEFGACNLGSLNLAEFVEEDEYGRYFSTWAFKDAVAVAVRALNDVLDEGMELHPLKEQRECAKEWRQIGLGIFGLADMLIKLGVRYGSEEAIQICNEIGDDMMSVAVHESHMLGKPFPKFDREKFDESGFVKKHALAKKYSTMTNSQLLTIAPTGTLSTMLGVSGGIEPIFANSYERRTESLHGKEVYYKVYTPIVKEYMDAHGITDEADLPDYFVTAHDIDWHERIAMQAAWQQHIDASISSTINLPHDATPEDIFNIYVEAWQAGLKGVTVFRDGCSRQAILSEHPEHSEPEKPKGRDAIPWGTVIEVNDDVIGKKRKLMTGCGSLHCVALFDPVNGNLLETYLSKGSNGGCQNFMIGLSRMISLAARAGVGIDNIIDQLESCGVCPSYAVRHATKHDTSSGSCCPVAVGRALKDMWEEMQVDIGNSPSDTDIKCDFDEPEEHDDTGPKCPECGAPLIFEGGCNICKNCGWSKCS